MNPLAQNRWNEFEQHMLNAMRQGQMMLGPHFLPFMLFLHNESRERDVLLAPINLPLTRVKQSIQARIDSTPDQLAIDRRETRQAAQAITARTATQAAQAITARPETELNPDRWRAAINSALLEPWLDGQLNGTWQQEPIGQNETPEEAVKRLVSVRAEWEVYKHNCENPVIADLRTAIATATQAADKAEDTVQGFLSQLRRALPFIENNTANEQGRKMLVDILMQHTKQAEGEATQ